MEQIRALVAATDEVPAVNQVEWMPFGFSRDLLEACRKDGIVIQAYSPLTRPQRLDSRALARVAGRYGRTPAQVLIRWT